MIETIYSVSEAEFSEANQLWCPEAIKQLPGYIISQCAYCLVVGFIFWNFQYLPVGSGLGLAFSIIFWLLIVRWRKNAITKARFALYAESMQAVLVIFDTEGYHDHKESRGTTWIAWKIFTGWRESTTIFVLGINQGFITIPKTCLSVDQQNELRTMLQTYISAAAKAAA